MSTPSLTFKTILTSVRPPRVAVLIDRSDKDWQQTCLRLIEFFTRLWGGKYNIIIPTDGETISHTFWHVLETYDPDCVYYYRKTGLDLMMSNPDKYGKILDREVKKFVETNPGADEEISRTSIDNMLQTSSLSPFSISKTLQEEVKSRLAPFWFMEYAVEAGALVAGIQPPFPLTAISKILPNCEHSQEVSVLNATLAGIPPIWYAPVTGLISESFAKELQAAGIRGFQVDIPEEDRTRLIALVMKGRVDTARIRHRLVAENKEEAPAAVVDYTPNLPFEISNTYIALYRSLKYQEWKEPVVVVVGESLDDFCLYYALSRMRENLAWLLPSWVQKSREARVRNASGGEKLNGDEWNATWFAQEALELAGLAPDKRIVFVSSSLTQTDLEAIRDDLSDAVIISSVRLKDIVDIRLSVDGLLRYPLVAYERDNAFRDVTKHFIDGESAGNFDSPKPKNFRYIDPIEHRWISQLSFNGHRFPRHPLIGSWVVRDHRLETHGARSGRNGLAYLCPNIAYFSGMGDIDGVLIKPRLYVGGAFQTFSFLLQGIGLGCRVSDKGFFAQETIRKFGALEETAAFLRDGVRRPMFDKYLDMRAPSKGVYDEGVPLNDQRRYLNFASIAKIIGSVDNTAKLIDDLVQRGILYRGFVFKCSYCRNAGWFEVGEISQEFRCKRCGRLQIYTRGHWRQPHEPTWFYKLDELVYQGHRNDMAVPLLALDYLRRQTEESFLYSNDLEILDQGTSQPILEMDICCIPDGVLTIGEAKREDHLGATAAEEAQIVAKYKELAVKLNATQVVFATLSSSWSAGTRTRIEAAFRDTRIAALILNGTDLVGSSPTN